MKKRILSISYDPSLLQTRHWILEQAGYEVSSAFGFAEAVEVCQTRHDFDLVLMGHSMPQKDKMALLEALRANCKAPLLSILRHGDSPISQAEYAVEANDGPDALVEAVYNALGRPEGHFS
jgi:CheY-like chemotaxis protein